MSTHREEPAEGERDQGDNPPRETEKRIQPALIKRRKRPKGWTPMSDWVLCRTKTGKENWARKNCENQAMETYLPRCQLPGKGTLQAVFPGYLFVRPEGKWKKLANTFGVIDIILRDGQPEYVPKTVMRELRRHEDREGVFVLPQQRTPLQGEFVQIKIGAFKNHMAIYDGLNAEGRVRVLLEFMEQQIELEFSKPYHVEVIERLKFRRAR